MVTPTPPLDETTATTSTTTSIVPKDDAAAPKVKGLKLLILLASVTLVTFLALLDTAILGTVRSLVQYIPAHVLTILQAIPAITTEFHSLPDVGWYIGAYQLASAILQPISGKLYTHFHSKGVFITFVAVFELGSLICGVAPSSMVFILGRAIAGLGLSGVVTGALSIIATSVEREKSPLYTGILFGVSQMGMLLCRRTSRTS